LAYENGTDSVPKHWHLNCRLRGKTQKKAYEMVSLLAIQDEIKHFNAIVLFCFVSTMFTPINPLYAEEFAVN
jgi:hypothetical protein